MGCLEVTKRICIFKRIKNNLMRVVREVSKCVMFTAIWALPLVTSKLFDNPSWGWMWIVSFVVTLFIFGHFEDLEKKDEREQEN